MSDPGAVLADLRDESEELDALVAKLPAERWAVPTPAEGWTLAHQIAHLAWTDRKALLAASDPERFTREAVPEALAAPLTFVDEGAEAGAKAPPAELLADWRTGREALWRALERWPAGEKLPWYGPPMSVASMASARLMETWAHGQDVADALGVARIPTGRLRHIARIGVRTRNFAYSVHQLAPPDEEFRVELRAPGGRGVWAYGPADAAQRVTGDALEFCLLVTQRAARADLPGLRAEGPDAERWLGIAQAFAGPPGKGRAPRSRGGAA
ncbi:TIGR03084 family metal-binding protein [Streptomyces natalensis]|uniref:Wyosine base formation domain-containing protein n=1 Tax=Streptomyces natalensis ATCC 27448 TaxID=1240678 RepID=A0A0D7CDZ3_9ACTN|nr:TIGR03084 family metal-binding protein [Streptomyces natalensis]KIZ13597.1 wyosine base formation domain-containing protein [Streptomyces natalensis ATCC 27448]